MKFMREFELTCQTSDPGVDVTIRSPMTLEFEVIRNTLASANTGRFSITNLKSNTRTRIFYDRYDFNSPGFRRVVSLRAGYQNQDPLPLIFTGDMTLGVSYRRGPDWTTNIEAFDSGSALVNGNANRAYPAGTEKKGIITDLIRSLSPLGLKLGAVGDFEGSLGRGFTVAGNTWGAIQNVAAGGIAFADNGVAHVLKPNEYVNGIGGIPVISSATGLLGTPRRQNATLIAEMIFEPRAQVGQLVELRSAERLNNGLYIINGVTHRGTISGAVDTGCRTFLNLWLGDQRLRGVTV